MKLTVVLTTLLLTLNSFAYCVNPRSEKIELGEYQVMTDKTFTFLKCKTSYSNRYFLLIEGENATRPLKFFAEDKEEKVLMLKGSLGGDYGNLIFTFKGWEGARNLDISQSIVKVNEL